jgi:hypothetical protein
MKPLPVLWQRLVSEAKTCDRCSATYQEMQRALEKLTQSLRPLGIDPRLEIRELDEKSFKADPSESNRIWIAGKPMEEWLGASVGSSRCLRLRHIGMPDGRSRGNGFRNHSRNAVYQGGPDRFLSVVELRKSGAGFTSSESSIRGQWGHGDRSNRRCSNAERVQAPHDLIDRLRKMRGPAVLTINGEADLVVQDAAALASFLEHLERLVPVVSVHR